MRYQRHHKILVVVLPVAGVLTLYAVARFILGHVQLWPCPSYTLLHILCPGCGATRAVQALLHGNVLLALRQNLSVPVMIVLACLYYLEFAFTVFGKKLRIPLLHSRAFVISLFVVWILYAVARNFIPALAPL